ncbi:hypothetical protein [Leptospira stimsonii]|uniref:Uncharacterized protein n=1 Tax=Leptospira stimsonii TaxID=2202203 RepID=A0ABY2N0L6_9LEPT|nr:hypothetical protein [Leptospira stimsonii]TGK10120.1 hypothetical protein EHO98_23145 [Leptospira stimsonii]TGM13559.1 hypothetical protein EHQ90_13795 [Leptospira stimsonii]
MGPLTGVLNFIYNASKSLEASIPGSPRVAKAHATYQIGKELKNSYDGNKSREERMEKLKSIASAAAEDPGKDIFTEIEKLNKIDSSEYFANDMENYGTIVIKKGTPTQNFEKNYMLQIYRIHQKELELGKR